MKSVAIIALTVLIVGVSITSIYAQSQSDIPSWVKNNAVWWGEDKISDSEFLSALQYLINNGNLKVASSSDDVIELEKELQSSKDLKDRYQQSMIDIKSENDKLKRDISDLEIENERLWKLLDDPHSSSSTPSYDVPSYDIPSYNEIRYDVDWDLNIGGLTIDIYSFGFMEPKPEKFSIDMDVRYTRGGTPVEFEVSQIRVTTDDHFSYESDKNQFLKFNGYYQEDTTNRAVVEIDDVPRELEGEFEILITVREIENGYYIQDYVFTFPTTLS